MFWFVIMSLCGLYGDGNNNNNNVMLTNVKVEFCIFPLFIEISLLIHRKLVLRIIKKCV